MKRTKDERRAAEQVALYNAITEDAHRSAREDRWSSHAQVMAIQEAQDQVLIAINKALGQFGLIAARVQNAYYVVRRQQT